MPLASYRNLGLLFQEPHLIQDWNKYLEESLEEFRSKFSKVSASGEEKISKSDFNFIKEIGKGAFGTVMLAKKINTGHIYAAKILNKEDLVKGQHVDVALNERDVLMSINFPFTVHIEFFFQDLKHLYFIMPYLEGGDLLNILEKFERFDEHLSRFYAAQILLALEYLHYVGVLYRDLKPENVLLDRYGYIRITDFGLSKITDRTYTMCGTPDYIAPEVLKLKGYGKSVDFWALGVVIYEMNSGITPFYSDKPAKVLKNVSKGNYKMFSHFSSDLKSLIENLLEVDATKRIGVLRNGVGDIKNHSWFHQITWMDLLNKAIEPPLIPDINQFEKPQSNQSKFLVVEGKLKL